MYMAHPPAPISHGIGTRLPKLRRLYPPEPLIMRSVLPWRSNCGPPSPNPRIGAAPLVKETTAVSLSICMCWIFSPLDVSMEKASGSGVNWTRRSPSFTVCARAAPRNFAAGAPNAVWSSVPSSGISPGFPSTRGATVKRKVCALTEVIAISTSLPATRRPVSAVLAAPPVTRAAPAAPRPWTIRRRERKDSSRILAILCLFIMTLPDASVSGIRRSLGASARYHAGYDVAMVPGCAGGGAAVWTGGGDPRGRGRQARPVPADLLLLRLRRAELHLQPQRQEAHPRVDRVEPGAHCDSHASSADHRRRHSGHEVGLDQRLYRRCRGPCGLRLDDCRPHLRHLHAEPCAALRRDRVHAGGSLVEARTVPARLAQHARRPRLGAAAQRLRQVGRTHSPVGAARGGAVWQGGSGNVAVGIVERARYFLLARHTRRVRQAVRLYRRRHQARAAQRESGRAGHHRARFHAVFRVSPPVPGALCSGS